MEELAKDSKRIQDEIADVIIDLDETVNALRILNEGEVVVCDLGAADYENQKINPVSDKKE